MKLLLIMSAAIVLLLVDMTGAQTIEDETMGYSVFLPENWVKTEVSETQHRFEDTSGTYQSMIVINSYDFSTEEVFTESKDWTRANFIAYSFSIDADPFSIMVFYDTVTAVQAEGLWAAEAFTEFFSTDSTLGDWAEYIRFTASGTTGYEIYALGPVEDMEVNVGYYVAIMGGFTLAAETGVTTGRQFPRVQCCSSFPGVVSQAYDLLGRLLVTRNGIPQVHSLTIHREQYSTERRVRFR